MHDLVQSSVGVRRLLQPRHDGFDELACQPRDALIFGLDTGAGFENEPRNVGRQPERENEREQQVDPAA